MIQEKMTETERIAFERFDKAEWADCSNSRLRVLLSVCHETITRCGAKIENLQDQLSALYSTAPVWTQEMLDQVEKDKQMLLSKVKPAPLWTADEVLLAGKEQNLVDRLQSVLDWLCREVPVGTYAATTNAITPQAIIKEIQSAALPAPVEPVAQMLAAEILERIADEQPINGNGLAQMRVLMAAASLRNSAAPQETATPQKEPTT